MTDLIKKELMETMTSQFKWSLRSLVSSSDIIEHSTLKIYAFSSFTDPWSNLKYLSNLFYFPSAPPLYSFYLIFLPKLNN